MTHSCNIPPHVIIVYLSTTFNFQFNLLNYAKMHFNCNFSANFPSSSYWYEHLAAFSDFHLEYPNFVDFRNHHLTTTFSVTSIVKSFFKLKFYILKLSWCIINFMIVFHTRVRPNSIALFRSKFWTSSPTLCTKLMNKNPRLKLHVLKIWNCMRSKFRSPRNYFPRALCQTSKPGNATACPVMNPVLASGTPTPKVCCTLPSL